MTDPRLQVDKLGVEIEGYWENIPRPSNNDLIHDIHEDGSVEFDDHDGSNDCTDDCEIDSYGDCIDHSPNNDGYIGECVSKPLSIDDAITFVDKCYPDETNSSCGLHVHLSVKSKIAYMKLTSPKFYDYFIKRITDWGHKKGIRQGSQFWKRLQGENTYCLNQFNPEAQYRTSEHYHGSRYTHLNYCYGLHGTVECRLFPAFQDKELAKSAVKEYYNIVQDYLSTQKITERSKHTIIYADDPKIEVERICA